MITGANPLHFRGAHLRFSGELRPGCDGAGHLIEHFRRGADGEFVGHHHEVVTGNIDEFSIHRHAEDFDDPPDAIEFRSFNRSSGRVGPCAETSQVTIADIKSVPSITTRCLIVAPQKDQLVFFSQARISFFTTPCTSVSRKCRP